MDKVNLNIEELSWANARESLNEPELIKIIDDLSPDENFTVFKASYPYGAKIFDKGIFYLPDDKKCTIPISDQRISTYIQEQLNYSHLPLSFLGEKGVEVCAELEDRVFSLAYFEQGLNLGVWEFFAPPTPFTVYAGARSLHMLPKITDAVGHKRLRRYGVRSPVPKRSFDQYHIFKEIINHTEFKQEWSCDLFFFSAKWADKIRSDKKWSNFKNFLWERAWKHTEFSRSKIYYDFMWKQFANILTKSHHRPKLYLLDNLKHLIFIALKMLPGSSPAITNNAAPIDRLLQIYLDEYGLKNYAPSLMQPAYSNLNTYIYNSLQAPTFLESAPKYHIPSNTRSDLAELIELVDRFMWEFYNHKLLDGSVQHINDALANIQFDYFHPEENRDAGINPASDVSIDDSNLLYMPPGYEKRKFCDSSSFLKGCIRISRK